MNNLRQFLSFKHQEFFEKKRLYFLAIKELATQNGVKVSLLILEDGTDYKNEKNNLGEQIHVTVANKTVDDFSAFKSLQTECKIVNVKKATIYGDFQNQLSIHADVVAMAPDGEKK